jgi:hypothetical protein
MKPSKLKQLLSEYGEILRVYCTPEDPHARKIRKQKGGNTGKRGGIQDESKRTGVVEVLPKPKHFMKVSLSSCFCL